MTDFRETSQQLKIVLDRIAQNKGNPQMIEQSINEAKQMTDKLVQQAEQHSPQTALVPGRLFFRLLRRRLQIRSRAAMHLSQLLQQQILADTRPSVEIVRAHRRLVQQ